MSLSCAACGPPSRTLMGFGKLPDGQLLRCPSCKSLRLQPYSEAPKVKEEAYGEAYHHHLNPSKATQCLMLLQSLIPHGSHQRLLDIGCGEGTFLSLAASAGWTAEGLEADSAAAAKVRALGFPVLEGRLGMPSSQAELPEPQPRYHLITLWDVLEHLPDPASAIAWLTASLRPGGRLLVVTPRAEGPLDQLAQCERLLSMGRSHHLLELCLNRYHLHRFSVKGLSNLLEREGLRTQKLVPLHLFSLHPSSYLAGFAPGISAISTYPLVNKGISSASFALLRTLGVANKHLYLGIKE